MGRVKNHSFCQQLWLDMHRGSRQRTKGARAERLGMGRSWWEVYQYGKPIWTGQAHCKWEAKYQASGKMKSRVAHMGTKIQVRLGVWRGRCGEPALPMVMRWRDTTCPDCLVFAPKKGKR